MVIWKEIDEALKSSEFYIPISQERLHGPPAELDPFGDSAAADGLQADVAARPRHRRLGHRRRHAGRTTIQFTSSGDTRDILKRWYTDPQKRMNQNCDSSSHFS